MDRNTKTDRIYLSVIAVLLLIVIAVIVISIFQAGRQTDSAAMVAHTQEVIIKSTELSSQINENESAVRGYVLSCNPVFFSAVANTKQDCHFSLNILKKLTRDNPLQQARLDTLSLYLEKRMRFSDSIVAMTKGGNRDAALNAIAAGIGKKHTDLIRQSLKIIIAEENRLLNERRQINETRIIRRNALTLILIISIVFMLVVFIQKTRVDLRNKRIAARELGRLNKDLADTLKEQTKELSLSKLNLEETFHRITDAVLAVDNTWRYTYVNKQLAELVQRDAESLIGKNIWEEFPDAVGSATYDLFHKAKKEQQYLWNEDYFPGLDLWQENHVYPTPDGITVYIRDISRRKRKEIRLIKLNAENEAYIKELNASNKELEQFAYVASHDLQEPLRMVTSFLSRLQDKYGTVLDEKGKTYIHYAVDGAMRMRQIILDLLEYSKIGKSETKTADIDLREMISSIINLHSKRIEETGAMINVDSLPHINASPGPTRQVFQNLIGNALKYVREGITPVINIMCEDNGDHWQFTVADNGIGINEVFFEKIFVIFQRLHTRDVHHGTGLGLAITKKIIENAGGSIRVESEEGKGSKFIFTVKK